MEIKSRVVADFGKGYLIEDDKRRIYQAYGRAKRVGYTCGDWVEARILNGQQAIIEKLLWRRNCLCRADFRKTKVIASNLDQVLFVVASVPRVNVDLLQRVMLGAAYTNLPFVLILNKSDMPGSNKLGHDLEFYRTLGYPIISISAIQSVDRLVAHLQGKVSLLVGQSGVGKSTIINQLLQTAKVKVGGVSEHLVGRHTTSHTTMHHLNASSSIVDAPGIQKFGLSYIPVARLLALFPEFRDYEGRCRFQNCTHYQEPGCIIKEAVKKGTAKESRLSFLQEVTLENLRRSLSEKSGAADGARTRDPRRDRPIL